MTFKCNIEKSGAAAWINFAGELRIPVPPKENLALTDNQEVVMGLLTEEITLTDKERLSQDDWILQGTIKVVEPLGNKIHLHVNVLGETFVARCEGRRIVEVGARINLHFNLEQLHIFDAESTDVVCRGS